MKYIIYDLEATQNTGTIKSEIIEVGAVALDENLNQISTFQAFIKPKMNPHLSGFIKKLTGINQHDIDNARSFSEVIEEFKQWIGEDEYFLCAWGKDDSVLFHRDCTLNEIGTDWIKNHNNIQNRYSEVCNLEKGKVVGLSDALEQLNIKKEIDGHRALNDAIYTVKIFIHIFKQIKLYTNDGPDMILLNNKKRKNRKRKNRMKKSLIQNGFSLRDIVGEKLTNFTSVENEG